MADQPTRIPAAEMTMDVLQYPQVIAVLDADDDDAVKKMQEVLAKGESATVDMSKTRGGFFAEGQIIMLPGIYNPVTHYFSLANQQELREFARIVAEYSKFWPSHAFFFAVNGSSDGPLLEPSTECLLMIMDESDVETVEGGCPPNGLYAVFKDGEVIVSSDKLYGGMPDNIAYFSKWLMLAS